MLRPIIVLEGNMKKIDVRTRIQVEEDALTGIIFLSVRSHPLVVMHCRCTFVDGFSSPRVIKCVVAFCLAAGLRFFVSHI